MNALKARRGVYACLGNHDNWVDADLVTDLFTLAGIRVLNNEGLRFEDRGAEIIQSARPCGGHDLPRVGPHCTFLVPPAVSIPGRDGERLRHDDPPRRAGPDRGRDFTPASDQDRPAVQERRDVRSDPGAKYPGISGGASSGFPKAEISTKEINRFPCARGTAP